MPLVCSASIGLLAVLHGLPASAQNGTWTALTGGDATGLWSDTASWGGGVIANGPGNTAFFNTLDITFPSIIRLDSARAIGSLIFGDTDTNTGANWTLDNNGNAANILTLAGAAPTISFGPTNAANRLTISTVLAGTAGLTYAGSGTILMTGNVGHTYTGGTILTGRVETTNVANAALTVFGAAVAANTLTFDGGYFQIFNTTGATSAGSLVNDLIVNTTGTLEMSGRSFTSGTLTGNGTFNVITHFVRSQFDGNWNAFTGTVNVTSGDAGVSDFRWSNYNGFANAILNLGTNTNTYFTPNQTNTAVPFAGTNLSIGALSGVSSATLRGGPIAGRVTNFLIGAKNVDTDFAGAIAEQTAGALTDILKQGTGTLTLSGGASAYNGPTRVDAGTLAVAVLADGGAVSSIGQSSNAAASLLLNGGTFKYIGTGHQPGHAERLRHRRGEFHQYRRAGAHWRRRCTHHRLRRQQHGRQYFFARHPGQWRGPHLSGQIRHRHLGACWREHLHRRDQHHRRHPEGRLAGEWRIAEQHRGFVQCSRESRHRRWHAALHRRRHRDGSGAHRRHRRGDARRVRHRSTRFQ
jgi:autotransporter-associated beta strand protein